ncbi:P-loop containing nucleoside triphosphate hydrolase protein [Kickxella alabastrina]|uniref:P-loop containing nucleoside triphosphate hydrolase protein n=1 Tax=Kickxella alabastrina TaxID=61397 RepID=UPI00221E9653|nr:P-loop containing nucleoside triphosphate hydrolase protein [Kickxella alabastrina]KAI7827362.1 P-loop containing nucleoside triphosphate hydrolase protein [Kickxella alabastrina]
MPFGAADAESIARALKILEPYTKGAKAWFEDGDEAWVKGTLIQRADDESVGIARLIFVRDDLVTSTTAHLVAQAGSHTLTTSSMGLTNCGARCRRGAASAPLQSPILDCTPDLTTLSYLHEPAVLYNLKRRYEQHLIYTYSGVVLVAMNPFHSVSLYTPEYMAQYARSKQVSGHSGEPHLFAIAEDAYRGMVNDRRNQTIIVYGESGSGKTTSAKYIMRYFAQAHHADTNDKQMSTVESQILATNPVFESFGNAKTTRNDNSSRFGKFLDIKFERKQQKIVGGRIRTFLLERSRVARRVAEAAEEFHIGGEHASWQAFHYTRQGGEGSGVIAGVNDADDFGETDASLEMVGIDASSAATFGERSLASCIWATWVCWHRLMGVSEAKLRQWLTKRQIVTRHDNILAKVNKAQALVIRDSIAKFVYSRLFDWILGPINKSILPTEVDERLTLFVGVLDIYGFEHFVHNSFEQFCINYANEKLQQNFNHHVFKLEQEEYKREQLKNWTFIGFQDNQPCIDLIEGRMGILALLDEESRLEQGSDRTFTEKLYRQFDLAAPNGGSAIPSPTAATAASCEIANYFRKPRFSNTAFTVKHYAHDVTYEGDGFLEKNKDTVPDEILDLLCSSSFELVASLAAGTSTNANATAVPSAASALSGASPRPMAGVVAAGIANLESGRNSPVVRPASPALGPSARGRNGNGLQRRQAPTLAGVFKRSLTGLMVTLAETEMHYIRCIKPNEAKKAWEFQAPMVLSQLRSCGVIETFASARPGAFQIGLTKVFFRAGQWAIMEKKRSALFEKSAMVIQRFCRGALIRRSYREMNAAATKIQRWYRKHLFTTQVENFRRRHAVRVIERRWIELCQHRKFVKKAQNAQRIQALCRGFLTRKRFNRMIEMHHMEETARLRDEAERARQAVDKERMRAEQARRGADNEKIRASTQAARSKAQMAAAEQIPTALGSYADMRRISTQSNEATRRRTAEARASLIAAATAGRNAEAELVRQQPSNGSNYSMYSSTACSPSYNGAQQRNAFGFQDGANISQQLQQIPEGMSPHVSKHRHQDSLTVGDDIFSIINEMSPVSDSRYGEVASRLQGQRELTKPTHPPSRYPASISPPPTVDYSVPPNSNGSENNKHANVQGYRRSVIVSNDSQNLIQQQQQRDVSSYPDGMPVTPRSRAASRLAEQSQNRRSWLMDALKSSHNSPTAFVAAAAIATVVVVDHGDMTLPASSTHESPASAAEEATPGSFRRKNIPVIRELSSQRNSQILTPQQQEQQEVALTAALGLLKKRESQESLKKATTLVSGI